MTAGGKREGAGRKPREAPLEALTMKLDPDLLAEFWRQAGEVSGPAFLAKLLRWRRPGQKRSDSKRRAKSNNGLLKVKT